MHDPALTTNTTSLRSGCIRLLTSISTFTLLATINVVVANCPAPGAEGKIPASVPFTAVDTGGDIALEMDSMEATRDGSWLLKGKVSISQGERSLKTEDATFDPKSQDFTTQSNVEYADPNLKVRGKAADLSPDGGATFEGAEFELPARSARGAAGRIHATAAGEVELNDVRYTTCPIGNEDWVIRASDIDISQSGGIGTGHNVRLDFKGIPILYTPFISFPVGNERKSGFLFPTFGTSSKSGTMLAVPWYWNIAPNYDATFVPTWYAKRGGKLDTELRYMSSFGRGKLTAEYLPDDQKFGDDRSFLHYVDQSDFTENLRLDIDAANVSDSRWFEDFGLGRDGTTVSYLNRSANLTYLTEHWLAIVRTQNFQTVDDERIDPSDRPYTVLPQLAVRADFPQTTYGLDFGLDLELSNFEHNLHDTLNPLTKGMRLDVSPEIRMPLRGSGVYLEPAASWRYTTYRLNDQGNGDESPTRSLPLFSLDGGMTFERNSGRHLQRLLTLEPRFLYLYVPYRDQSELPVFDTTSADWNLVQLFRTNRFVGADRLSNANQVSIGFTSRLIDASTGQQFIAATIGQAYYIDAPRVALPDESLDDTKSSDLIAELQLTAYRNWNVRMGVQWDPSDTRSERGDLQIQYKPRYDQVANVGYRFRRGSIEQVDSSVAWPIADNWSAYAAMVYSLEDSKTIEQLAGAEYRSCCWRMRLVGGRSVDRTGNLDTSVLLQLELNGLSSVGVGADAFLERSIRGYSLRPEEPGSTLHR